MIEHFDFQELSGPDEVTSYLDVRFGWLWFTARVIARGKYNLRIIQQLQI
jgi:hypothetical protein